MSMEDLPGNVVADILTRLPVKTIIHCKCVCKKWREYVSESYFVNLHLSRSPAGVMIHHNCQPQDFIYHPDFAYHRDDKPGVLKLLEVEHEGLYAFDVDSETFHLFPSPPYKEKHGNIRSQSLGVFKGCLCQCDSSPNEFTIWVMKEYGIKKSWHKEVVINQSISRDLDWLIYEHVTVLKGLEDGTILMLLRDHCLLVYCPRKNTIEKREMFRIFFTGIAYRPSFLKLKTFESESVHVL
uniref:F-box associated domain, type 1 n=1 Tax=Tanacetum cinerariifolium TaxID=118510 RepID=A0A6L2N8X9_TANCI|nr:F-box associated domain, type 1 [Tanacetum cinerariifolium]